MPGAGGTCASCGLPVRQETDDSLQCVRGYSGVRSAPPGRGGGHEDFWWCCNCLLKFRGVRSSTTPCEFCLLRTGTVWDAVQNARKGLETAEKAREKEAARVRLRELREEKIQLQQVVTNTKNEIRNMQGLAEIQAQLNLLQSQLVKTSDGTEDKKEIEAKIKQVQKNITDFDNIETILKLVKDETSSLTTKVDVETNETIKLNLMSTLQQTKNKLKKMIQLQNGISAYQQQIAAIDVECGRLTIITTK